MGRGGSISNFTLKETSIKESKNLDHLHGEGAIGGICSDGAGYDSLADGG